MHERCLAPFGHAKRSEHDLHFLGDVHSGVSFGKSCSSEAPRHERKVRCDEVPSQGEVSFDRSARPDVSRERQRCRFIHVQQTPERFQTELIIALQDVGNMCPAGEVIARLDEGEDILQTLVLDYAHGPHITSTPGR